MKIMDWKFESEIKVSVTVTILFLEMPFIIF